MIEPGKRHDRSHDRSHAIPPGRIICRQGPQALCGGAAVPVLRRAGDFARHADAGVAAVQHRQQGLWRLCADRNRLGDPLRPGGDRSRGQARSCRPCRRRLCQADQGSAVCAVSGGNKPRRQAGPVRPGQHREQFRTAEAGPGRSHADRQDPARHAAGRRRFRHAPQGAHIARRRRSGPAAERQAGSLVRCPGGQGSGFHRPGHRLPEPWRQQGAGTGGRLGRRRRHAFSPCWSRC